MNERGVRLFSIQTRNHWHNNDSCQRDFIVCVHCFVYYGALWVLSLQTEDKVYIANNARNCYTGVGVSSENRVEGIFSLYV